MSLSRALVEQHRVVALAMDCDRAAASSGSRSATELLSGSAN